MSIGISIRPSKDLRTNYGQISALTRQNPVAITVNGREDTVLMSHEEYLAQQAALEEMKELLRKPRSHVIVSLKTCSALLIVVV